MYRISKTFRFEASHQLLDLPVGHQCGRLHGHSYELTVEFIGHQVHQPQGWLFDFGGLWPIKKFIEDHLDHRHLNDIVDQPTSENLARYMFDTITGMLNSEYTDLSIDAPDDLILEKVRISETRSTYAEYYGWSDDARRK